MMTPPDPTAPRVRPDPPPGASGAFVLGSRPAFFAELFDTTVRFSAVGIADNIGTVLTGGLAPMLASALLLWFDHSVTGVVVFIALMSALTVVTVAPARETRGAADPAEETAARLENLQTAP
ncbi:hypothetical protein AB0D24_17755 [Streptomyces javensis]|uniref:hypothetical protein n=1 Tax=Streptomyces javensis TaxID=114698 RepID=UPI0033E04D8E